MTAYGDMQLYAYPLKQKIRGHARSNKPIGDMHALVRVPGT